LCFGVNFQDVVNLHLFVQAFLDNGSGLKQARACKNNPDEAQPRPNPGLSPNSGYDRKSIPTELWGTGMCTKQVVEAPVISR